LITKRSYWEKGEERRGEERREEKGRGGESG
jgi:hypothetical protein